MTPLAGACLALLKAEAGMPPLSAESIGKVLWVTGQSPEGRPATVPEIESATGELLAGGQVERVWRLGAAAYRVIPSQAPPPEAA